MRTAPAAGLWSPSADARCGTTMSVGAGLVLASLTGLLWERDNTELL